MQFPLALDTRPCILRMHAGQLILDERMYVHRPGRIIAFLFFFSPPSVRSSPLRSTFRSDLSLYRYFIVAFTAEDTGRSIWGKPSKYLFELWRFTTDHPVYCCARWARYFEIQWKRNATNMIILAMFEANLLLNCVIKYKIMDYVWKQTMNERRIRAHFFFFFFVKLGWSFIERPVKHLGEKFRAENTKLDSGPRQNHRQWSTKQL